MSGRSIGWLDTPGSVDVSDDKWRQPHVERRGLDQRRNIGRSGGLVRLALPAYPQLAHYTGTASRHCWKYAGWRLDRHKVFPAGRWTRFGIVTTIRPRQEPG